MGAEVRVRICDRNALRLVSAGSGYASQSVGRVYFGLDEAESVDRLTVRWPRGGEQSRASTRSEPDSASASSRVSR